jgi:CubicO group peptidase (beta-lactamase class C family)
MGANGKLEKVTKYFPYPEPQTYFSGGAGLVSTAADYARFAQMLLNKGELEGKYILSRKSVELMTTNSIGNIFIFTSFAHNGIMGDKFGYGFGIRTERGIFDELESLGTFGWDGAFYTRFWVDPKEDLIGIFMSQVDNYWSENLIGKFKNLVFQSISD